MGRFAIQCGTRVAVNSHSNTDNLQSEEISCVAWSLSGSSELTHGPRLLLGTVRGYLMLYDVAAKELLWRKRTSHRRCSKLMEWSAGDIVALASSNLVCIDVSWGCFGDPLRPCSLSHTDVVFTCGETFLDDVPDR